MTDFRNKDNHEKIMWRSGEFLLPEAMPKEEAFSKLLDELTRPEGVYKRKTTLNPIYIAAATIAGVLFLALGWLIHKTAGKEELIAGKGQLTDFVLPDGSKVFMNADTRLSYNKNRFSHQRNVSVSGEAYFEIEKGNSFIIETDVADVYILGTSFNLFAREDRFSLSCFTGKVQVKTGKETVAVLPGEMAVIESGKLVLYRDRDVYKATGWRNGELIFEHSGLIEVFREIERQYNVTFVLPKLDNQYFTGSFSNKNLVEALDNVCVPMKLTYEIGSNSKIYIKKTSP